MTTPADRPTRTERRVRRDLPDRLARMAMQAQRRTLRRQHAALRAFGHRCRCRYTGPWMDWHQRWQRARDLEDEARAMWAALEGSRKERAG